MPKCDIILFDLAIEQTSPISLAVNLSHPLQLAIDQVRLAELDIEPVKEFTMTEL